MMLCFSEPDELLDYVYRSCPPSSQEAHHVFTTPILTQNVNTSHYEEALASICDADETNPLRMGFQRFLDVVTRRFEVPRIDLTTIRKSSSIEHTIQMFIVLSLQYYVC